MGLGWTGIDYNAQSQAAGGYYFYRPSPFGALLVGGGPGTAAPPPAPAAAAPVPAPQAATEAMAAASGGAISNTKIPVSWGDRRVYGKVIDHIVKGIDATGFGAETLCISAGEPLFRDIPNNLYKITSGSTVIYDETEGGIVHPAVNSVTWYDGTSDDQPQDPTFVARYGADVVPGYVGQMIAIVDFNTYEPWAGSRPEPFTIFIQDAVGGGAYQPWGGVWSSEDKASNLDLSDSNRTVSTNNPSGDNAGMVRSTVGRSAGRRYFELTINAAGGAVVGGLPLGAMRWGFTKKDADWEIGSLGVDGNSLAVDMAGSYFVSGFLGSWPFQCPMLVGSRIGVACDLSAGGSRPRQWWQTADGVNWWGLNFLSQSAENYPLANSGSAFLLDFTNEVIYLAFQGYEHGDSITLHTTLDEFLYTPPGYTGETIPGALRNWGEVFVELAKKSNLDPNHVILQNITEASEGGIIYDGFAWTDVVTNAGKISNIDWWEDGQDIIIKQTAFDNPPNDVPSIPTSHRYIIDEDRGATDAERGGERRKPVVYSIGYYDVSRQFQESFMMARSEVHLSVHEEKLSTPFVMTATEAATRSAIALGKSEMEFEEHHIELPPIIPYMQLRPADIVSFLEEGKTMQTKVSQWTLETDWTVKTSYRKLFTTATNPVVPFTGEIIDANMPEYATGHILFTDPNNSGLWALFEDI